MTTRSKVSPPVPLRKPATLDHLRKKPKFSQWVAFCTEAIPEPAGLSAKATPAQRAAYLREREEWQQAVEAATVEFRIQALARRDYRELVEAHPPTPEEIEEAKRKEQPVPEFHEDTFCPALIAASICEPQGVTLRDAQAIWDEWDHGEALTLAGACIAINSHSRLDFYQKKSETTGG